MREDDGNVSAGEQHQELIDERFLWRQDVP